MADASEFVNGKEPRRRGTRGVALVFGIALLLVKLSSDSKVLNEWKIHKMFDSLEAERSFSLTAVQQETADKSMRKQKVNVSKPLYNAPANITQLMSSSTEGECKQSQLDLYFQGNKCQTRRDGTTVCINPGYVVKHMEMERRFVNETRAFEVLNDPQIFPKLFHRDDSCQVIVMENVIPKGRIKHKNEWSANYSFYRDFLSDAYEIFTANGVKPHDLNICGNMIVKGENIRILDFDLYQLNQDPVAIRETNLAHLNKILDKVKVLTEQHRQKESPKSTCQHPVSPAAAVNEVSDESMPKKNGSIDKGVAEPDNAANITQLMRSTSNGECKQSQLDLYFRGNKCETRSNNVTTVCINPDYVVKRMQPGTYRHETEAFKVLNNTRFFPELFIRDDSCHVIVMENIIPKGMSPINKWSANFTFYRGFLTEAYEIFTANGIMPKDLNTCCNMVVKGDYVRIFDFDRYWLNRKPAAVRKINRAHFKDLLVEVKDFTEKHRQKQEDPRNWQMKHVGEGCGQSQLDSYFEGSKCHSRRNETTICINRDNVVKHMLPATYQREKLAFDVLNDTRFFPALYHKDDDCHVLVMENIIPKGENESEENKHRNEWSANFSYYSDFLVQAYDIFTANGIRPLDLNTCCNMIVKGEYIRIFDFDRYWMDHDPVKLREMNRADLLKKLDEVMELTEEYKEKV